MTKGLSSDIELFIDDKNSFTPVCCNSAGLIQASIGVQIERKDIFILEPCVCDVEEDKIDATLN